MRWNPFTMWWEHRRQHQAVIQLAEKIGQDIRKLTEEMMEHRAMVGKELHQLKYGRPSAHSTLGNPLTPEQEEIVKEFNENSSLPEQIRRHFARDGHFGSIAMRAAMGRFGEAPSEQTRSTDQINPAVYAYDEAVPTTRVDVTFSTPPDMNYEDLRRKIAEMPLSMKMRRDDYPGSFKLPPSTYLPQKVRESGFPPREKSMDEMIREDNAERDQLAQDQADLDEMDKPKE